MDYRGARLSEEILKEDRVECHFECHHARKIGKRTQADENAGNDWKTLTRCGCER